MRSDYGELALDRLRVFVQQRGVPVLLSSRPDGYKLFKAKLSGWADGHIADLSELQQRRLATTWFAHQLRNANEDLADEVVSQRTMAEVETFFEDLHDSPDLAQLAAVPLLLCLLIALRRAEVALPRSRFRVYEEVVKHLLEAHPRRRRRAAAMADDDNTLSSTDMRQAFERLAYEMHCAYPEGMIPIETASEVVAAYLQDGEVGVGLERIEARRVGARLVDVGETNTGLLVGRSPREAGFFHRSLQEFLAAGYLSRINDQLEVVQTRRLDPQWREVLLGALHFTRRTQDAREFINRLRAPGGTVAQRQHLAQLLAEAAFGEFPVPPAVAQEIARDTLTAIEHETWAPQRERLLSHSLDGLQSAKVRDLVHERLRRWFPERLRHPAAVLEAMGTWPIEDETVSLLLRGLHAEDASRRISAAKALAALGCQQPTLFNELARVAMQAQSLDAQAGAVYALVRGWPEALDLSEMLDYHATSPDPDQRLIAYAGLAKQGRLGDEQLEEVLHFRSYRSEISYFLRHLVVEVLVQGWPGDLRVRDACLSGLSQAGMDKDLNWQVLFQGFASDLRVQDAVSEEIREKESPFLSLHDAWPQLLRRFRDVPALVRAIEVRLKRGDLTDHDLHFASLIGQTAFSKTKLLENLNDDYRHWPAEALLEGWGMDDPEIAPRLLELATGPDDVAASIAFLIPDILRDPATARQRLIALLRDPKCARPDFVLNGLYKVGVGEDGQSILDAALIYLDRSSNGADYVFRLFPQETRVLRYAEQLLEKGAGWAAGAIAHYLGHEESIRRALRDQSMPLDPGLRFAIASKLRQRLGDPEEVLSLLEAHHEESDVETRVQCSISLAHRARTEGRQLAPTIEYFMQEMHAHRVSLRVAMRTGIAGLLTLRAIDALTVEVHGRRILDWIPLLLDNYETPGNFVATVARHWEDVRDVVRPALTEGREGGFAREVGLEALAAYADGSSLAGQDLLEVIERDRTIRHSPAVLRFLGRVLPGSGLLLEACLDVLREENPRRDTSLAAAQLLGKYFGGNISVLERLTTATGSVPPQEDVLMAIVEGWPESPVVKEAYDWYTLNRESLSYSLYFRLAGLHSTPEQLITALNATFKSCAAAPAIASQSIVPPLVRRLRQDPAFGTALATWLTTDRNPSAIATIPRLLARAGVLSDELREWCATEIERLSGENTTAPIGTDLIAGRVRPVLHSLLDAI
ncbi:NACHT domain-containing protein [Deinococcus humi]|uniref:HEAT repeat domain-containing protein n=1 Tax=Deinococcus humi TaxID=662880 RepID=A0A7W8NFJ5_9DEIO|nr:hypothetical protein [Deinococcus humi]MBB5364501.1 hypothetical protein [Deinococcus humi]GGI66839.1 hypothetical protein GCM10008949_53740 [Deinococcus humi]